MLSAEAVRDEISGYVSMKRLWFALTKMPVKHPRMAIFSIPVLCDKSR
jgi:hypothetical protein